MNRCFHRSNRSKGLSRWLLQGAVLSLVACSDTSQEGAGGASGSDGQGGSGATLSGGAAAAGASSGASFGGGGASIAGAAGSSVGNGGAAAGSSGAGGASASSGAGGSADHGGASGEAGNSGAGGQPDNVGAAGGDPDGSAGADAAGAGGEGPDDSRELGQPDADVPNPIVSHIFTADPSAYVFEGRIYVYASHDPDDQTGYDMVDYHVFSSDDLANWRDHGVVLKAEDISFAEKLYAPDCAYDAELDKYFLYFPDAGSAIGVATSDDPGGPFENPVQLVSPQTPGAEDVDWLFDPTAFFDDDGQAYLYFGGGPSGTGDNARVIRLNPDRVSLMDTSATTIVVPDFFEASFLFKRNGIYYYSYSTGFDNHSPTIDYMVSDNPMSGFEFVGTVIPNPAENNGDNNHHSMVEYQGQWYVFYHNRVIANRDGYSNYQRSITLDKLSWEGDRMVPVSAERGEVKQLRSVDAFKTIQAELLAGQSGIETDFAMQGAERVGVAVTDLQDGDWLAVSQVDFGDGANTLHARASSVAGGNIEVLQGGCQGFRSEPGTVIGTCEVAATGSAETWRDVDCAVQAEAGVHDLCLRFTGTGEQLMDLDYYSFE